MKEQLQLLLKLQEADLEADRIRASKGEIDQKLAEYEAVLAQLRADLETQNQDLDETVELHKDKSREYAEVDERLKGSKTRLNKVSNTKEYAAIELEIENAKRQAAQLEEELEQLQVAIDGTREASTEKGAKIDALNEQVTLEKKEAKGQLDEFDKRLKEIEASRGDVKDGITKSLMRRYDFIRSRRNGTALVAAADGCCQGCFMQLPAQLYIEVMRSNAFKTCPSCQRILYFEEALEDGDPATA